MESTLCLRYGPLRTLPLHIPSLVGSTKVTKPETSFSHSSLSLSIPDRSYRPVGNAFSSVVRAINRFPTPSTNDGSDNKIVRGTEGASLALATVLAIISCGYTMNPKAIAAPLRTLQRSSSTKEVGSPIYAKGGKAALESLLGMTVYLASSPAKLPAKMPTKPLRSKLLPGEDVEYLKLEAMSLMKSGQGDEAVKQLTKKYNDCKGAESKFFVEMALVEVLICLGKYGDALKCKCLSEQPSEPLPSDGRVPLYKAIIYTMMDKKEDAKECWEDFIGAIDGGLPPLKSMI